MGDSMSSVIISGNTSGAITLAAPDVSGSNTATLPAATGTVMVSGNMPAFSAYSNAQQTVSGSTWTKVVCGVEEFDTSNNYTSSTFTPTVAGYYQVSGCISWDATVSVSRGFSQLYKNGGTFKYLSDLTSPSRSGGSCLIYMNGTTDYLELYGYMTGTGTLYFAASQQATYFQATLVRAA